MTQLQTLRSIESVRMLVAMAEEEGFPPAAVLEGTGISMAQIEQPDAEIFGRQELRVIENLLRLGVEPSFGLRAGLRYRISSFGMLGYGLMNCTTVRTAAQMCIKYSGLMYSLCNVHIDESESEGYVVFGTDLPSPDVAAFIVERDAAALAKIFHDMTGIRPAVRRWWLAHPQRAPLPVYQQVLDGVIEFNKPVNMFVLDKSRLELPMPFANAATRIYCEQICEELLSRRTASTGFEGRIRDYLIRRAQRMPSMEDVAEAFHMTSRTVRRRLLEEGTTFRELVEDVRREIAEALLRDGKLTVQEIASRLGYLDATSFITAFKRWTGTTPAMYRRTSLSEDRSEVFRK
ncbi:MAG: AraC family transcriptional regulator [Pseudomonadota bacterium]